MLNIAGKKICYCCGLQLIPKTVTAQMDVMLGSKFVEGAIPGKKVKQKADTEDSAGMQIIYMYICTCRCETTNSINQSKFYLNSVHFITVQHKLSRAFQTDMHNKIT